MDFEFHKFLSLDEDGVRRLNEHIASLVSDDQMVMMRGNIIDCLALHEFAAKAGDQSGSDVSRDRAATRERPRPWPVHRHRDRSLV